MKKAIIILLSFSVILSFFACRPKVKHIAVFGDSLAKDSRWQDELCSIQKGISISNFAVNGMTTIEMRQKISDMAESGHDFSQYDTIIFWCGINDVSRHINSSSSQEAISDILARPEFSGKKMFWITVPNPVKFYAYDERWKQFTLRLNVFLGQQTGRVAVIYCGDEMWEQSEQYTKDDVHLNSSGNKKLAKTISTVLFDDDKVKWREVKQ